MSEQRDRPDLHATVVIDYQNVHLVAHNLFAASRGLLQHESLVDPLHFSNQLIQARNRSQKDGFPLASLRRVLVYRGQPSPAHDPVPHARNQAQQAQWERDARVSVHHRQLKYRWRRDRMGALILDSSGNRVLERKQEKGIDVLCALALVRETQRDDTDLVILASHDTDLTPALDEALDLGRAVVETFAWFDATQPHRITQLRPSTRRVWNTRLGETEFVNAWDRTDYSKVGQS
ncbi:NYN domain-containing protein [Actinomycetospora sp. NBRC 106378]|uniref:NYN domain-containing protein n=1 Tax=Actinomycetospora sp. NBRC 106378 TaxID=3032208 RepID=UPI0024A4F2BF|nr:NYN domain-containing protein [Actinomycetospora sp. NBRC 106378]GLZ54140.1 hypothetical protein Acsp07_37570 [Actinomycetospora sp. NBRC 106378]